MGSLTTHGRTYISQLSSFPGWGRLIHSTQETHSLVATVLLGAQENVFILVSFKIRRKKEL